MIASLASCACITSGATCRYRGCASINRKTVNLPTRTILTHAFASRTKGRITLSDARAANTGTGSYDTSGLGRGDILQSQH